MLTRKIKIQLVIFAVVTVVSASVMLSVYLELPSLLFGLGRYTVTLQLPEAAGLYTRGNVTYRGTEVGRVDAVDLTNDGVSARLSLDKGFAIPSDLRAEVHSQSAVGEQFVDLIPRNASAPPLKDGDVIPESATTVPPDINTLLDATNRGLTAIPRDNLKTVIDESYTAAGGLGSDISRIVRGSTQLAKDARANLDGITNLIDQSAPVLTSQADTADDIRAWATHLAGITGQLRAQNGSVTRLLEQGGPAAEEGRKLLARMQPTLPVLLANLVSVGDVALTYRADLEQLLVLIPQGLAEMQATGTAGRNTKHPGTYLDFKLNLNLPPPCTTGYLPPQQVRTPALEDYPDRPPGDLYCRLPQDAQFNVRGIRNTPCETVPGKRAPTVKMCESDENYVPLNDGYNWKGDPNATLSGQPVPQLFPAAGPGGSGPAPAAPPPPIAIAPYDPATGSYLGPDGKVVTQSDLGHGPPKDWQSMLLPPGQ